MPRADPASKTGGFSAHSPCMLMPLILCGLDFVSARDMHIPRTGECLLLEIKNGLDGRTWISYCLEVIVEARIGTGGWS